MIIIIVIQSTLLILLAISNYLLRRQVGKMELIILNRTNEMIELEKNYEESLQTIKELHKIYGKSEAD